MMEIQKHRRDILKSLVAMGGIVGVSSLGSSTAYAEQEVVQTFELEGEIPGWEGVSPSEIAGEANPTLELEEEDGLYRVEWTNVDGARAGHNFAIDDFEGNTVFESDMVRSQGETQVVEFEADSEMAEYFCEPHPSSMRGEMIVGDDPQALRRLEGEADIVLEALSTGWVGHAPEDIAGVENPTLELEAGDRVDIGWANGDGDTHNLAIVDEDGEVIESTETHDEEHARDTLTLSVTAEVAGYISENNPETMRGEINVEGDEEPEDDPLNELIEESDYVLEGLTAAWEGISPDAIESEENPTLEFEAGEEYTVGWINGDGDSHNFALRDADEEVLESTDIIDGEGVTQTLTFEATTEIDEYVCQPHVETMNGDVEVTAGDSDDDNGPTDDGDEPGNDAVDGVDDADDDGPGFGVATTLAALGAGAAAAMKRLSGDNSD